MIMIYRIGLIGLDQAYLNTCLALRCISKKLFTTPQKCIFIESINKYALCSSNELSHLLFYNSTYLIHLSLLVRSHDIQSCVVSQKFVKNGNSYFI